MDNAAPNSTSKSTSKLLIPTKKTLPSGVNAGGSPDSLQYFPNANKVNEAESKEPLETATPSINKKHDTELLLEIVANSTSNKKFLKLLKAKESPCVYNLSEFSNKPYSSKLININGEICPIDNSSTKLVIVCKLGEEYYVIKNSEIFSFNSRNGGGLLRNSEIIDPNAHESNIDEAKTQPNEVVELSDQKATLIESEGINHPPTSPKTLNIESQSRIGEINTSSQAKTIITPNISTVAVKSVNRITIEQPDEDSKVSREDDESNMQKQKNQYEFNTLLFVLKQYRTYDEDASLIKKIEEFDSPCFYSFSKFPKDTKQGLKESNKTEIFNEEDQIMVYRYEGELKFLKLDKVNTILEKSELDILKKSEIIYPSNTTDKA